MASSSSSLVSLDPLSPSSPSSQTPSSSSSSQVAKELLAGTVAGWAQVFVGQPFDIVKVRLQAGNVAYKGAMDCARQLAKQDGFKGFYKGTTMPLVGIGACVSLQFACLQAGKRFFVERNAQRGQEKPETLTPFQFYLAGAFAGIGNSVASGPVEHIRIRLQTQTDSRYLGPIDAIKKIYRSDGFRGVYQGQGATLAREAHGYGVYFAVYELLVANEMKTQGFIKREELNLGQSAIFGAAAGWGMWLFNYPLDVLKSRLQTDSFPSEGARKYPRGMTDAIPALYNEGGAGAFFRGLGPTMIRYVSAYLSIPSLARTLEGAVLLSYFFLLPSLALALPRQQQQSNLLNKRQDSTSVASDAAQPQATGSPVTIQVDPSTSSDSSTPSSSDDDTSSTPSSDAQDGSDSSTPSTDDSSPPSDDSSTPDNSSAQPVNSDDSSQTPDDSSYQPTQSYDQDQPQSGYESVPYQNDGSAYVDPSQQGGGEYYPSTDQGYYPSQGGYDQGYVPSQYDPQGYSGGGGGYDPQSYAGGGAQEPQTGGYYSPQDPQGGYSNSPSSSDSQPQDSIPDSTTTGGGDSTGNQDAANTLASLIADSLGGVTN